MFNLHCNCNFSLLGETPFDDVVIRLLLKAIEEDHHPLRPENCSAEMLAYFHVYVGVYFTKHVLLHILYQIQFNEVMLEAKRSSAFI